MPAEPVVPVLPFTPAALAGAGLGFGRATGPVLPVLPAGAFAPAVCGGRRVIGFERTMGAGACVASGGAVFCAGVCRAAGLRTEAARTLGVRPLEMHIANRQSRAFKWLALSYECKRL